MQKNVEGFLEKLSELSLSYGIAIGGCGWFSVFNKYRWRD